MQTWDACVAAFANDTAVDRQVIAGLHHVSNVVLPWRAVGSYGGRTVQISIFFIPFSIDETHLGPVPPENMVVTPAAIASFACCGHMK